MTNASPKVLLSESELARATNRSERYVKNARQMGLVAPLGATPRGRFIYDQSAVEAVNGINAPVFNRGAVMGISSEAIRLHGVFASQLQPDTRPAA